MTLLMLLMAWFLVSVPAAIVVGFVLRSDDRPELVGMDGPSAVFVRSDGRVVRMPLIEAARH